MSTAERRRLTPAEYLAAEQSAGMRHEFLDGEVFAMTGGSLWHNLVKDNLAAAIRGRLDGRGCYVVTSDQRVKVDATGLYTYPDVVILCEKPRFEDGIHSTLVNPGILVEVLSESTEAYDRGRKFAHYRQIPSLQEYLLVAQDRVAVDHYTRGGAEAWGFVAVNDPAGAVVFPSLGVTIPVATIYAGVEFPE